MSSKQVQRLAKGRHHHPGQGVCAMELCSMLAGEAFSDRPHSACDRLGAFLRGLNDHLPGDQRRRLLPAAADVVGTRSADRDVLEHRTERLLGMGRRMYATRRLRSPLGAHYDLADPLLGLEVAGGHCGDAVRRDPAAAGPVLALLAELCATEEPRRPAPDRDRRPTLVGAGA